MVRRERVCNLSEELLPIRPPFCVGGKELFKLVEGYYTQVRKSRFGSSSPWWKELIFGKAGGAGGGPDLASYLAAGAEIRLLRHCC